jgi:hypothetical protein
MTTMAAHWRFALTAARLGLEALLVSPVGDLDLKATLALIDQFIADPALTPVQCQEWKDLRACALHRRDASQCAIDGEHAITHVRPAV